MQPATQMTQAAYDANMQCATQNYRLARLPYRHKTIINDRVFSLRMTDNSMVDSGVKQEDMLIVEPNKELEDGLIVAALVDKEMLIRRYFKIGNKICLAPDNVEVASVEISPQQFQFCGVVTKVIPTFRAHTS